MNGNDNLVWILLGLGAVFFFWRAIWGLAVLGGVLAVLVYVWAHPGYSDSAKLIASGIAIAAGSLLFPKKKDGGGGVTKKGSKQGTYVPACGQCNGTGRKTCIYCSGSGEGPGSLGHVLGPSVSCPHCLNGYVRCGCGA